MVLALYILQYIYSGTTARLTVVWYDTQAFDVCIEASGTAAGVLLAVGMTRSMGTVVLKTTCSTQVSHIFHT